MRSARSRSEGSVCWSSATYAYEKRDRRTESGMDGERRALQPLVLVFRCIVLVELDELPFDAL